MIIYLDIIHSHYYNYTNYKFHCSVFGLRIKGGTNFEENIRQSSSSLGTEAAEKNRII